MKSLFFCSVILSSLLGCLNTSSLNDKDLNSLNKLLETYKIESKNKCLIIPVDNGCSHCLSLAKNLIAEQKRNENILFIVSGYNVKNIKLYLDKEYSNKNIVIDTLGIAVSKGMVHEYPVFFDLTQQNNKGFKEDVSLTNIERIKKRISVL